MGNDKWMIPVAALIALTLCWLALWLLTTEVGCSSFVVVPISLVLATTLMTDEAEIPLHDEYDSSVADAAQKVLDLRVKRDIQRKKVRKTVAKLGSRARSGPVVRGLIDWLLGR